jgi:hypothetical protein
MTIVLQRVCMNLNIFVTYENFQKLSLTLYKRIEDENIVIEQTQLIEKIKWFLCLLNLIICVLHAYMIYHLLE